MSVDRMIKLTQISTTICSHAAAAADGGDVFVSRRQRLCRAAV